MTERVDDSSAANGDSPDDDGHAAEGRQRPSAGSPPRATLPEHGSDADQATAFLFDVPLPLDEAVPTRIGGYRVLRVLGLGGMGTVYQAEQESTRRFVAVKVIHPHLATPRYRRRFAEEIRTLGRFEHPGIARIYEAGSSPDDQGALRLFFAMEMVTGLSFDAHAKARGLDAPAIAALGATICDAVHHAHQKGVIHCDLKPANILVTDEGVPKVLDFGIARLLDDTVDAAATATLMTAHPGIVGTLAFASPEQAGGDRNQLDVLTDVYGLGAVLYTALAQRPPHDVHGCGLAQSLAVVRERAPVRLRSINPSCPPDLEIIVEKAMSWSQRERYSSAAAMAEDLRRFLAGRPITARPSAWHEVAVKWMRRNRLTSAALFGAAVVLGLAATMVTAALVKSNEAWKESVAQQEDHEGSLRALQGSHCASDARHQLGTVFVRRLRRDEVPDYPGRVLAALPWSASTPAARARSTLLSFDDKGNVIEPLDGPRAWPAWARPRFAGMGAFDDRIDRPQHARTLVATIAQCDDDDARELVRGLKMMDEHLHMAVLEIEEISALIEASGAARRTTGQLWNRGDFRDLVWDAERQLIWTVVNAEELPFYEPWLAGWDTAGCPVGGDVPRLLLAIDLGGQQGVRGVIPPLVGDAAHPPIRPKWAFITRAPALMRGVGTPTPADLAGVGRLHVQAFEPFAPELQAGLGRLYLTLTKADVAGDSIVSVVLNDQGVPTGALQVDPTGDAQADQRAAMLAANLDPSQEIVSINMETLERATAEAEELMRHSRDGAAAMEALQQHGRDGSRSGRVAASDVAKCIEAMSNNWRWLLASASEILRDPGVLASLGEQPSEDSAAWADAALWRIETARSRHAARCPARGDDFCQCEWFMESSRALALSAAGRWAECIDAAQHAARLHERHAHLGTGDVLDFALMAIAYRASGDAAQADASLVEAERQQRLSEAANAKSHQGGVAPIATAVLARARTFLRGD